MEIAKQKLELANKELESKDKIIEQMNETIDILKWRVEVQESMTSQIKDIADRLGNLCKECIRRSSEFISFACRGYGRASNS